MPYLLRLIFGYAALRTACGGKGEGGATPPGLRFSLCFPQGKRGVGFCEVFIFSKNIKATICHFSTRLKIEGKPLLGADVHRQFVETFLRFLFLHP